MRLARRFGCSTVLILVLAVALESSSVTSAARPGGHGPMARALPAPLAQQRATAARVRSLRGPAAWGRRAKSRVAYRGLSGAGALTTARRAFPSLLSDPTYQRPTLGPRSRVQRYLGDHRAIVRTPSGRHAMVFSTTPLRAADGRRGRAPVDLALTRRGRYFVPKSAPVPAALPARLGDGARLLHSGVGITPVTRSPDSPARQVAGRLFYPNVDRDTDQVIEPRPAGLESYVLLRSPASPEHVAFQLTLPPRATAQRRSDGQGIDVARDGRTVATIARPVAADADGKPVPATYAIKDRLLRIDVPHRGGSFRYPLLIDPSLTEQFDFRSSSSSLNSATGWTFFTYGHPNVFRYTSVGPEGIGLYSYVPQNVTFYGPGTGFTWGDQGSVLWAAPPGTNIFRVDSTTSTVQFWDYLTIARGIFNPANNTWGIGTKARTDTFTNFTNWSVWQCADHLQSDLNPTTGCSESAGAEGNQWWMQFFATKTGADNLGTAYAYLSAANIYIHDGHNPGVSIPTSETGRAWRPENQTAQFTASASDTGLGLTDIRVTSDDNAVNQQSTAPCNGHRDSRCPTTAPSTSPSWTPSFSYSTNALREGITHMTSTSGDAGGNRSPAVLWDVKVDRSRPVLTTSGPLKDAANDYPGANSDLHIVASDPYSGVASVEVKVDGIVKQTFTNPSPCDGCGLDKHWNWHAADYGSGPHTITVTATDATTGSPHQTTDEWSVTGDDIAPDVAIDGSLWSADGATISGATYDLTVDASDGDSADTGVGVKSIVIQVDAQTVASSPAQTCGTEVCPLSLTWQMQVANYADGPHHIDIDVTDQLGNVTHDEEDVTVQKIVSSPPETLSLEGSATQSINGAAPQDGSGRSVADVGDVNGDGRDDYAIGAPGALVTPSGGVARVNAGKVYVVYGTATGAPPSNLSSFGPGAGYTVSGGAELDRCGTAVAAGGDVNQDGLDDLLVGCPATDGTVSPPLARGHVYVLFGRPTASDVDLATLGSAGFAIAGPPVPAGVFTAGARPFGSYLSGPRGGTFGVAADVNDDGYDDITIGSSSDGANARVGSGSTYVVFGKASTTPVDVTALAGAGFRIDGGTPAEHSGYAAAIVGDVSGDDYADILVTSPGANQLGRANAGVAYLVYGKASDTNNVDLAALSTQGFAIYGKDGDKLGSSVASIGDVDSDGLADFAIGGHGGFVVYGHDTTDAVDFQAPDLGYRLQVPADASFDNASVAGGGDLNDDGLPDVLVAFPAANGGAGSVFAVLSQAGLDPPSAPIALDNLPGQQGTRLDAAGSSAAGTSLDGVEQGSDGLPGVLVGAPGGSTTATSQPGAAYVVPASSFKANGSGSGTVSAAKVECWKKHSAYPFNDAFKTFPRKCRWTKKANLDETFLSQKNGFKGRSKGVPRQYGGNLAVYVRSGHVLNGYAKTQLIDSDGATLGYLQQARRPHDRFTFYDANQLNPVTRRGIRIRLEATPCMTSGTGADHDPGANALISLQGSGNGANASPLVGMRAILRRSAFSAGSFSKHFTNDQVINSAWLSCHKLPHYRKLNRSTNRDYVGPRYDISQRYLGIGKATVCERRKDRYPKGQFDPNCGTPYIHYQFPRDPFPTFPEIAILSSSTTGVGKGGQARGVIKASTASPLHTNEFDSIEYLDPNVPCGQDRVAAWFYLGFKGVRGWYVATRDDGTPRTGGGC
jgi:hypothetical protein